MAAVRDLAKFSAVAYNSSQTRYGDWEQIRHFGDKSGLGFNAVLFINETLNEAAFAIRGTDLEGMDMSDIYANAQIALRIRPHQLSATEIAYEAALLSELQIIPK